MRETDSIVDFVYNSKSHCYPVLKHVTNVNKVHGTSFSRYPTKRLGLTENKSYIKQNDGEKQTHEPSISSNFRLFSRETKDSNT